MELLITIGIIGTPLLVFAVLFFIYLYDYSKEAIVIEARKTALKESAQIARDAADFELYDTEGRCGQRMERARIGHAIELEILSRVKTPPHQC